MAIFVFFAHFISSLLRKEGIKAILPFVSLLSVNGTGLAIYLPEVLDRYIPSRQFSRIIDARLCHDTLYLKLR